jgi:hypothetical protein
MDATRSANDGSFSPQNALALSIRKDVGAVRCGAVRTSGASLRIFPRSKLSSARLTSGNLHVIAQVAEVTLLLHVLYDDVVQVPTTSAAAAKSYCDRLAAAQLHEPTRRSKSRSRQ